MRTEKNSVRICKFTNNETGEPMKTTLPLKHAIILISFFTASAVAITVMMMSGFTVKKVQGSEEAYVSKINEIKTLVDEYYIGEYSEDDMPDFITAGYVLGLGDKYSNYVTKADAEENLNSFIGLNTGMGVQVTQHPDDKSLYVLEVHKDSPALAAGIECGDHITAIDGQSVNETGYSETLQYIKSRPLGSDITLTVLRGEETLSMPVTLNQYTSQTVCPKLIGNIGYVQITEFNDASTDQFTAAVDELINEGAAALVFDLRGNGGGTLKSVYHMIDYLIPEGLAVKVEYKDERNNEVYMSDSHEITLPMAVLTDGRTASASELFAQSLKDYEKAVTVGSKTYGKGVVQRTFTLSDGSLVKFTVGKYYTANGECLDGIGVLPDISTEWTSDELTYRLVNGIETDKDFLAAVGHLNGQLS